MPLSDHEKRLLAQMEEALAADDPRLVSTLSGPISLSRNRVLGGIALVLVGIATLFVGLVAQITIVGLVGFLIALTGLVLLVGAFSRFGSASMGSFKAPAGGRKGARRGFGDRMQDRWDQRNNE
jgi:hypothetical protein